MLILIINVLFGKIDLLTKINIKMKLFCKILLVASFMIAFNACQIRNSESKTVPVTDTVQVTPDSVDTAIVVEDIK